MDSTLLQQEPAPPAEVVRAAATLVLDSNPRVHRVCEEKLLAWGQASLSPLESLAECEDPKARSRIRRLLRKLNIKLWTRGFLDYVGRGAFDLEEGLLLLSRLSRPLLDMRRISGQFDSWAGMLAPFVASRGTKKIAEVLSDFFFWELGFKGDSRNYYNPDNCYLDQVVRQRRGIPISLCSVYLLVGRRLGLPLQGVGLPGHFILRLEGPRSVLLDPFHGGRILTRKDCLDRLQAMGYFFRESFLDPVTDEQMLLRILGNLLHTYRYRDDEDILEALRLAQEALLPHQEKA